MIKVSIHQPNYIPWLGYFRKLIHSDIFVFFDNVQMPGGKSYVYRAGIQINKTHHWLSVPLSNKSSFKPIKEIRISDNKWIKNHIKSLDLNYAFSPWRNLINDNIEPVLSAEYSLISDLNINLIKVILDILDISHVDLLLASSLILNNSGADSIEEILLKLGATTYLTGSGKGTTRHLNLDQMDEVGICTHFISSDFPDYSQRNNEHIPGLSILDCILNCGPRYTRQILLSNY
jgi:hypothetical protein